MTTAGDAHEIVQTALRAAVPQPLDPDGGPYAVVLHDDVHIIDMEPYAIRPRRKTGHVVVSDPASFAAVWAKHADEGSDLYADIHAHTITAVFDAHDAISPRWQQHTAKLAFQMTRSWQSWVGLSGQLVDQETLAEHFEQRIPDIVTPTGAEMLELAQTFHANNKVVFESSSMLQSGQRRLTFHEEVNATAGQRGQITIPASFELGLQPWEGADRFKVTARFRFRITNGRLTIGYVLERPEDVVTTAFEAALEAVEAEVDRVAIRGTVD